MAWAPKMAVEAKLLSEAGDQLHSAGDLSSANFPSLGTSLTVQPPSRSHSVPSAVEPTNNPVAPEWNYRDAVIKPRLAAALPLIEATGSLQGAQAKFDFPFLADATTVHYLSEEGTRLMVILRGLSGSGKSTLCERIKTELTAAGVQVDVASADHFFQQPNGQYKFDRALLPDAHDASHKECERLCAGGHIQVIIIDNTNIFHWEFMPYLRIAYRHHFVTLLVQPNTPWRYDYRELARRNIHGVEAAAIKSKVEKLREGFFNPMYYGFMISAADSGDLRVWAARLARSILQIDELSHTVDCEEQLLVNEFVRRTDENLATWQKGEDLLHCTAFFTYFGKRPGLNVRGFEESAIVQGNLGKLHQLKVRGLLITSRTISFHVQLTDLQLKLWRQEEEVERGLPRGARAHLTVVTAGGIEAVESGRDTMKLAELALTSQPEATSTISTGKVSKYDETFWYLALDRPKLVNSLFAPFYCR